MPTNEEKRTLAQAEVIQRAREEKAARTSKPDKSARVKAFALGTVQGHDEEGLPVEHVRGEVFDSTENEVKGLERHGIARLATDDEIAAADDSEGDVEDEPEPSETDETAPGRTIRNYHEYKHEATVDGGSAPDAEVVQEDGLGDEEVEEPDSTEVVDPSTMSKKAVSAELVKLGYEVDKSASLDDLRAALVTARAEEAE